MSRKKGPEPFFREDRQTWYVQLHGKQHNLGKHEAEAKRRWHTLMAMPRPVASSLVAGVVEGFLDWCQRNRSGRTYEWSRGHLESFCRSLPNPAEFLVSDLKPHHVLAWADSHKGWGPSHRRGAIGSVQRAFNWAEKVGHLDRNPIRHVEKPAQGRRKDYLTLEQYEDVIGCYDEDDPFRSLVEFTWETGTRPQEVKEVEARHFVRDRRRIEIPPDEAKGKNRWRVIYLTDRSFEVVAMLARKHPKGPLFRNEDGNPWTAWSTNCRLERLKDKLGYKVSVYSLRHSFCQRMLEAGLDATTVAALMGHVNVVMVSSVYSHMNKARDFLADQLKKAAG